MFKKFIKEIDWFLSSASIDYVSLDEICGKFTENSTAIPNQNEFDSAMIFIKYLDYKYGNSFFLC